MFAIVIVVFGVILSVALMTQAERKIMGAMQRRIGPNKVGVIGVLQPFADALKQLLKEAVLPAESSNLQFEATPFLSLYLALLAWLVLPQGYGLVLAELLGAGILIIVAISELSIYGVIYSGWASNSKYAFLGSLRSTAQMISYSVSLTLILLTVIFTLGTVNLLDIVAYQRIRLLGVLFEALFPMAILFMIEAVAETNRSPFDLPEAESELVAGFMTEYSSTPFVFFFLAEYTNILAISTLLFLLFFGISMALPIIFFMIRMREPTYMVVSS